MIVEKRSARNDPTKINIPAMPIKSPNSEGAIALLPDGSRGPTFLHPAEGDGGPFSISSCILNTIPSRETSTIKPIRCEFDLQALQDSAK